MPSHAPPVEEVEAQYNGTSSIDSATPAAANQAGFWTPPSQACHPRQKPSTSLAMTTREMTSTSQRFGV